MRRFLKSSSALGVAAAMLVSLAAACGSSGDGTATADKPGADGKKQAVTLILDWTPNTNHSGFYLAKAKGLYAQEGLDVTIVEPDENGGLPQIAAGNAQFAVSVAESLLPARAAGAEVVSIGAILAHNTSSLVIPADRNVTTAKDLEGKKYGGYGGELEKALVDTMVRCAGGDPTKVDYVEVGNVDYKVGFDQHQFDAVWVFDGWDVIRLRDLEGTKVTTLPFHTELGQAGCIPDWYTPLVATSQQMIDTRPETVRAFMKATAAGFEQARTDPEGAAKALLDAAPELDRELVTRSAAYLAPRYADQGEAWGVQSAKTWTDFAAFLTQNKILTGDLDVTKAYTNDFLPEGKKPTS